MNYYIYNIRDNYIDEKSLYNLFNEFDCSILNEDVDNFLKNTAIDFSNYRKSSTFIVIGEDNDEVNIAGYFSLANKITAISENNLSKTMVKKISRYAIKDTNNCYQLPMPLLAQMGKNYNCDKLITGKLLLEMALTILKKSINSLSGSFVYVECDDEYKLLDFYNQNGFIEFGERDKEGKKDGKVHQLLLDISKYKELEL